MFHCAAKQKAGKHTVAKVFFPFFFCMKYFLALATQAFWKWKFMHGVAPRLGSVTLLNNPFGLMNERLVEV